MRILQSQVVFLFILFLALVEGFLSPSIERSIQLLSSSGSHPVLSNRRLSHQCPRSLFFGPLRVTQSTRDDTDTSTTTATSNNSNTAERVQVEEETLSDVDTRVLQSMLQDSKIDLNTEEDIKKLLERGTVKKVKQPPTKQLSDEDSEFSSTVLKTLGNTKLWKAVSAQASDAFESLGIWVSNKVEQDVKTLLALGVFAWDRAVRDVARALPAASTRAKKTVLSLTNSSSFSEDNTSTGRATIKSRPADEIKSVSREVMGILSGQQRAGTGRSLRTAAPAGSLNAGERQRRAYRQRRRIDRQDKDMTRIAGNVVDSAFELRRELKAETNKPGYKTEPVRKAIEAGVVGTGNLLQSVKESARLSAAKRKEARRLQQARDNSLPSFTSMEELAGALRDEEHRIGRLLNECIEDPSNTWLNKDVIEGSMKEFDEQSLRSLVFSMVLLKSSIRNHESEDLNASVESLLSSLEDIKLGVEEVYQEACKSLPAKVGVELRNQLYGLQESSEKPLILLLNDKIDPAIMIQSPSTATFEQMKEDQVRAKESVDNLASEPAGFVDATVVVETNDVSRGTVESVTSNQNYFFAGQHEVVSPTAHDEVARENLVAEIVSDNDDARTVDSSEMENDGLVAELVNDIDFEANFGGRKATTAADLDEEEVKEPNLAIQLTLRTLDVIFFVLEKVFIAGIPRTITVTGTAVRRLQAVNTKGMGASGWQQISKVRDSKGRY